MLMSGCFSSVSQVYRKRDRLDPGGDNRCDGAEHDRGCAYEPRWRRLQVRCRGDSGESKNRAGEPLKARDRPYSLGPVATAGCAVAPVENTTASPGGTGRTESVGGVAQYGRQRPWSLASRPEQSSLCGALQCLLQIARSSVLVRNALA